MVKKNCIKGGVAIFDNAICNKTNICNLQDLNFNHKEYAPTNFGKLDDRPTNFALNPDITGGKNNKKIKKGGNFFASPDYFDLKGLNYQNPFKNTDFGKFDDRGTNFSLSPDFVGGNLTKSKKNLFKKNLFQLVNKSFLNYVNKNKSLYNTYSSSGGAMDNMILSSLNTTDLKFAPYNIIPVNKISNAPRSNFEF